MRKRICVTWCSYSAHKFSCRLERIKVFLLFLFCIFSNSAVELAVIGCLKFFDPESLLINIMRLAEMPSSMPSVLIASYARLYLSRVAINLMPENRTPHWKCFNDLMQNLPNKPVNMYCFN